METHVKFQVFNLMTNCYFFQKNDKMNELELTIYQQKLLVQQVNRIKSYHSIFMNIIHAKLN